MQWYEEEVRSLETAIRTQNLTTPVVFYGSSSMRLWSTLIEDVGRDDVLNLAFGGSTLEACVYFFDRLVLAAKPRSVVLYAGDNDLGDGRTVEQVVGYFRDFRDKMERELPGVPLGFISIKGSPARWGISNRIIDVNTAIQASLAEMPNAYYINIFDPMLGADGKPVADYFQPDGLHLSTLGYKVWTKAILEHRDEFFCR